jgi:hypothetical protein
MQTRSCKAIVRTPKADQAAILPQVVRQVSERTRHSNVSYAEATIVRSWPGV